MQRINDICLIAWQREYPTVVAFCTSLVGVWFAEIGTAEEDDIISFLCCSNSTLNHLVGRFLVNRSAGLHHIERPLCLNGWNQFLIGIHKVEILVVTHIAVGTAKLHIQVVCTFRESLCIGIEVGSNGCPLRPAACILVVNRQEGFVVFVVKDETNCTYTRILGSTRHLELRTAHFSEIDILVQEDVARSSILHVASPLVVISSTTLRHYSLVERHSVQRIGHLCISQFEVHLLRKRERPGDP